MRDSQNNKTLDYCERHTTPPDDVLFEIERNSYLRTVTPQMITGRYQGVLLEMISRMVAPRRALEIGTFTGYGAICIARGLHPDGTLTAIEVNPEREGLIREHLGLAGITDRVDLRIENAFDFLKTTTDTFDLIYIDAGKRDNPEYYRRSIDALDRGGIIILDNVLWGGKVLTQPMDTDTQTIHELNRFIASDDRVDVIMLPVRDGISVVRKK